MCKIRMKVRVIDSGNSPYNVNDELLIGVDYKREAQLE